MPRLFRKKPVIIEAVQWTGANQDEIFAFARRVEEDGPLPKAFIANGVLYIYTSEGTMRADVSDWIIKGVAGEFYPCKASVFQQTYEAVTSEVP